MRNESLKYGLSKVDLFKKTNTCLTIESKSQRGTKILTDNPRLSQNDTCFFRLNENFIL